MKVVINSDFGGFNLSEKAFEMLLNKKGIEWEKVETGRAFGMSGVEYYYKGHAGESDYYLLDYDFYENRADKDLIEVVESLKSEANGFASSLKVIEIPENVEWYIEEYDGREWVAERHRTWN